MPIFTYKATIVVTTRGQQPTVEGFAEFLRAKTNNYVREIEVMEL